jgi:transglutaminase-like putative cysteine protease
MTADYRRLRLAVAALLFTALVGSVARGEDPAKQLDANLPYQAERSEPVTHEVDFSVVVTPPYGCKLLRVWLPLPQSDFGQEISKDFFTSFPDRVEMQVTQEPVYGNRFAYFEFHQPQGAQIIRHRFTAKVWELRWSLDPERVSDVKDWPAEFERYLQPNAIARQAEFVQTLREIAPQPPVRAEGLFRVMDWIDANLTYDHVDASLRADPQHAFLKRHGHCSDYHGLCATMGRALGYPTRITYGLSLFAKNSPSHCKLEAFLPPYGWVSFDVSETQQLIRRIAADDALPAAEKDRLSAAARARTDRGFRENSWLLVTKGTDYDLAPKASQPVRVVRTIYAEADGQPLPDPDPANPQQREFAWMTAHKYTADKPFKLPFKDPSTLTQDAE